MGMRDWFRIRRHASALTQAIPKCSFCSDPGSAQLDELAADGARAIYLCRCPECGRYWGGHAYQPQYWWELSPEEAAEYFPDAFETKE
jgi:ribosomal protein L37AE/L43A